MGDEQQPQAQENAISVDDALKEVIYRARKAREAIERFPGVMLEVTQRRMATNLGRIITLAKEHGIHKGDIVVKSGVRPGTGPERAVNALNNYCLLPKKNTRRNSPPRLTARPKNYLALALAAAELMKSKGHQGILNKHQAILMLVENTNMFESTTKLAEESFSPAEIVLGSLMTRLSVLVRKHKLADYFREVQEFSATYDPYRRIGDEIWARESHSATSVNHWPEVLLTAVVRSSARATMEVDGKEVDGELLVVDSVFLTLGWDLQGHIIPWLQFRPALVANPFCDHPKAPWTDYNNSTYCQYFEVRSEGSVGVFKYKFKDGEKLAFTIEQNYKRWPDGASPTRARFERLSASLLATTLGEGRAQYVRDQGLSLHLETSDLVSPPASALAMIEAELLRDPTQKAPDSSFLNGLEEDIIELTSSFSAWKAASVDCALKEHERVRANDLLAIEKLDL